MSENNNLYLENLRSKILVVFSGQMRSYEFAHKYTLKKLNKFNPSILLTTWKNQQAHQDDNINLKKYINNDLNVNAIYEIYKPIYLDLQNNDIEITKSSLGNDNKFDFVFPYRLISTRFQFYKFNRIYNILTKLKNEHKIQFEKILFIRPDICLLSNINLDKIKKNHIYFEDTLGNWNYQRSDRIFYGDYDIIMSFLENICDYAKHYWNNDYIKDINKLPFQENLIKMYLDQYKIKSLPFHPAFRILREQNYLKKSEIFLNYFDKYKRIIKRQIFNNKS